MSPELEAFKVVDFDWTRHLDSVWEDGNSNSKELNGALADELTDYVLSPTEPGGSSPLGRVIIGAAGAGKTHLMGELRREVWRRKGWFILLDLADVNDFWPSVALSYLQSLQRTFNGRFTQGDEILLQLCAKIPAIEAVLKSNFNLIFSGEGKDIIKLADAIVGALRQDYRTQTQQHHNTIKAFVVFQARDPGLSDSAYSWLQGVEVEDSPFGPTIKPRDVIRGLSWLMSLTGPTLLAVDQIDAIVAVHNHALTAEDSDEPEQQRALKIIDELAGGLMALRDITRRTTILLSSLEATWQVLQHRALAPAMDRFREPDYIRPLGNGVAAETIVTGRLQAAYVARNFKPPPSSPFLISAFDGTVGMLPRELLKRYDAHRRKCLAEGRISDLASFEAKENVEGPPPSLGGITERFVRLCKDASLGDFLKPNTGETSFPELLLDALRCYVLQTDIPDDVDLVVESDPNRRRTPLHARLRRIYRSEGDREEHHCFRAIGHDNAIAFQSRLKAAMTAAGIDMALPFRHLFIIRRDAPPTGTKTKQLCQEFEKAGGKLIPLSDDDLRIMVALQTMLRAPEGFQPWLRQRKPLCDIAMFRDAGLCVPHASPVKPPSKSAPQSEVTHPNSDAAEPYGDAGEPHRETKRPVPAKPLAQDSSPDIFIGRRLIGGQLEQRRYLSLALLPRHTAVLAGSGSGKTVLLRRIIEEAALQGVPAIVLDINNDLARLGDAWPEIPATWDESDRDKAKRYAAKVEVVVWTPGIAGGKPIMLAPMPEFGTVRGDEDELQQTVAMAHASLKPLIGATGAKAKLKEGILMQALRYFAPSGKEGLAAFVRLLSELPPEVSDIGNAAKLAGEMSDHFKAEIAKNPLLSFKGTPLDPKTLFTAKDKSKTKVSVINFSGLPADDSKQSFVNQLEMTLFSWIKKNPRPSGRPLTGLLVMDEAQNFAPAQKSTPCKESTIALVAQARKYGLGMIFATQAPKNIDNKVITNCTTHFYGKMNAPATIDAVQELMAAKGGGGSDIGNLKAGEFYFSSEGMPAAEKVKTPLCLSYHPQNPLSQEEVIKHAKTSA